VFPELTERKFNMTIFDKTCLEILHYCIEINEQGGTTTFKSLLTSLQAPIHDLTPSIMDKVLKWLEKEELCNVKYYDTSQFSIKATPKGYKHYYAMLAESEKEDKGKLKMKIKEEPLFETISNSYTKIEQIGAGGSGIVLKVKNEEGAHFALKYLSPDKITTTKLKRFQNELSFCSNNNHPNVITVIDRGHIIKNDIKCPFYVMRFYPKTLRNLIEDGIKPENILYLFSQILDGIETAHLLKIWHRDLKPENILYDTDTNKLVVADFGIAHFEEDFLQTTVLTQSNERLANFQYASPEQRIQGSIINHKADIYALGMILNEMFTRIPPQGVDFKVIANVAPSYEYLDKLVFKMMQQLPDQRPNSIDEIKKELIALNNAFINRQKLSELNKTVIKTSEISDPLVITPVKIINVDYSQGKLVLKLSQNVNARWIQAFKSINIHPIQREGRPENYNFINDIATIPLQEESSYQSVVDLFKECLIITTTNYRKYLEEIQRNKENEENEALKRKIAEEKRREAIIKNVKI
jgi:serine/threonine protein kinase